MIEIYGSPSSSSGRCYWCLEEVGAKYESKSISFKEKEHKNENFLKLNPNGKVPCLVDEDFVIWESVAINFYLAEKFKSELLGTNTKEKGLVQQWSIWSMSELQPPLIQIFIQLVFVPEERRSQQTIDKAKEKLPKLFQTIENSLNSNYLVNDKFSLADLNVVSVIDVAQRLKVDLSAYPKMNAWLERVQDRESFKKFQVLCKD